MAQQAEKRKIRVLLTNDDGPPSHDSPFILGWYLHLVKHGYDVKVVLPSSQKSWIGKAYHIKEKISGRYYYPRPFGAKSNTGAPIKPETSDVSRPLKEGELGEWILLDGTPATCANIALHNLYPSQIDLVISGPNLGRNTSSAFVLSSGTIGAAMSSSLAMVRSIALSYGVFVHPNPPEFEQPSHELALKIVEKLMDNWGQDSTSPRNGEVELYNVNVPLVKKLLEPGGVEVVWTRIWRNRYASLFRSVPKDSVVEVSPAGPDSDANNTSLTTASTLRPSKSQLPSGATTPVNAATLNFHFAPQMDALVNPKIDSLPFGTDAWAVHHDMASVTPLRTSFAEPDDASFESSKFDFADVVESEGKHAPVVGRAWKL